MKQRLTAPLRLAIGAIGTFCLATLSWGLNAAEKPTNTVAHREKADIPRSSLNISRTPTSPAPALIEAYRFLQTGDLDRAEESYALHLDSEPHHPDALLGMAAVMQRRGQWAKSEYWYQQVVATAPENSHAQAAIISLRSASDPQAAESHLHQLLDTRVDSAPLHFALGNLHASQKRWSKARQAYARALSSDTGNPDYAYNLAVSLDRLSLTEEAETHYRNALSAARFRASSFDPEQIAVRLAWQTTPPSSNSGRPQ